VNTRRGRQGPVIAVTGLLAEARVAAGPGVRTVAGGGGAALAALLQAELARGVRAVMSFGIAGGLDEHLACGTWVVARAVVTPDARWPCDAAWVRSLAARLPGAVTAALAGVDAPVTEPAGKRALQHATGAVAVDTESHVVAALAAAHGVPFAAFRVVADSARRMLPPAALVGLAADGRIRGTAVLASLARAPTQLPALWRTAIDAGAALRALSRGRRLLGRDLGYPDGSELLLDVL
jgi:hopanoid-associated phosphorylase